MPNRAESHIQKTAPAPPVMIAPATPAILPTPIVAARAVERAWNWEMELSSFPVCAVTCFFLKMARNVSFIQCLICVIWKNFIPTVR